MAVPKKRTSCSKKNTRKAVWKRKASTSAGKAFSLAQAVLSGRSHSFCYISSLPTQTNNQSEILQSSSQNSKKNRP